MKLTIFLLVASVLAHRNSRTFYAKVNDIYSSLGIVYTPEHNYISLASESFPKIPSFLLVDGTAVKRYGRPKKYFGHNKGAIVYGVRSKVTPFNVQLDSNKKVRNLTGYECHFNGSTSLEYLRVEKVDAPLTKCISVEFYFLTSDEVKMLNSSVPQNHISMNEKREISFEKGLF